MKLHRRFQKDRAGAVEGLPFQFIIMVAIVAIVILIILGWLAPRQVKADLDMLTVEPQTIDCGNTTTITITALDTKDNHLEGVVIQISGCNVEPLVGTTDADGVVTFTITPDIPAGHTGQIKIKGTYTGTIQVEKIVFIVVS